ncbi:MAG TPA: OadG family protein [Bacillota bacterium]|jgi:Na+-transporting methylmalonyl-CoA/oxaloacetate decarboxylase gamma subunit|nr:OadG family protein [Bacillota bacterium]
MNLEMMRAGFDVMLFGLGGVFSVLILFYLSTKIMLQIAKKINAKNE